ncbi:hypothetical protein V3O24_00845 [Methylobacter sp. Wu8]|uniref:hypothetical protein n=1 Tax=Methylobacter sp. Wu8 TaxID=3118457 RepID=UPI002F3236C9
MGILIEYFELFCFRTKRFVWRFLVLTSIFLNLSIAYSAEIEKDGISYQIVSAHDLTEGLSFWKWSHDDPTVFDGVNVAVAGGIEILPCAPSFNAGDISSLSFNDLNNVATNVFGGETLEPLDQNLAYLHLYYADAKPETVQKLLREYITIANDLTDTSSSCRQINGSNVTDIFGIVYGQVKGGLGRTQGECYDHPSQFPYIAHQGCRHISVHDIELKKYFITSSDHRTKSLKGIAETLGPAIIERFIIPTK